MEKKCNGVCGTFACPGEGQKQNDRTCSNCYVSMEASYHTRRCFMTGEYCSQKTNIQKERNRLHNKKYGGHIAISAFVIMNFSDMSDVVYKWRIKDFIESLKKYLYVDQDMKKLYCVADANCVPQGLHKVEEIRVVRSDSDPASNYVICSRICQQMQVADLIIVDVSTQNPNVFYEFGMAVALDKLILPICFSESFYKIEYPKKVRKMPEGQRKNVEHHIGCYPWRKMLFEYYGIRYRQNDKPMDQQTRYLEYDIIKDENNGFSDIQYSRFPYVEPLRSNETEILGGSQESVGKFLYNRLKDQYNNAAKDKNTLVVYTMERFLNEDQAGKCIVNFYHSITERMQQEQCFCGERVGVLVQGNVVPESDKDAKEQRNLLYNVGEVIHIGVNQATYLAAKEKVESEEIFVYPGDILSTGDMKNFKNNIIDFVKSHISNRGMIVYPNNPVYVERVNNLLPDGILNITKNGCYPLDAFCLYHVMLKTLRYTNEIVVDISNNNIQALFWLGAAHGSEIYAVTVKHELSEKERKLIQSNEKYRNVFDVAGLWTAHYFSNNTEEFYHQLALAQFGIEKHSKIIPSHASWRGIRRWEYFEKEKESGLNGSLTEDGESSETQEEEKIKKMALESYYRRRFWNAMLRHNRLRIYLSQRDDMSTEDSEPRVRAAKWDMDAASALTHYLSKRSVIGEYVVLTLPEDRTDCNAEKVNYICVGQPAQPSVISLPQYIYQSFPDNLGGENINRIHQHRQEWIKHNDEECKTLEKGKEEIKSKYQMKGFEQLGNEKKGFFSPHPWALCVKCETEQKKDICKIICRDLEGLESADCPLKNYLSHTEIAQLILWRQNEENNYHFRVSIVGSSGPATYALASLFVDEDQKLRDFLENEKTQIFSEDRMLLYELQARVRKKIYSSLMDQLKGKILEELKELMTSEAGCKSCEQYGDQILYAMYSYLSTVLYRYFLPFLTEKDIYRIYNGVYMYVHSMKAAKQEPFCMDCVPLKNDDSKKYVRRKTLMNIIDMLPNEVRNFLESFKGIEAFYKVTVQVADDENLSSEIAKDWRKVTEITPLGENEGEEDINFFIIPQKDNGC